MNGIIKHPGPKVKKKIKHIIITLLELKVTILHFTNQNVFVSLHHSYPMLNNFCDIYSWYNLGRCRMLLYFSSRKLTKIFKISFRRSPHLVRNKCDVGLGVQGPPDEDEVLVLLQQEDGRHKDGIQHEEGEHLEQLRREKRLTKFNDGCGAIARRIAPYGLF